jgi:hypothetical protein
MTSSIRSRSSRSRAKTAASRFVSLGSFMVVDRPTLLEQVFIRTHAPQAAAEGHGSAQPPRPRRSPRSRPGAARLRPASAEATPAGARAAAPVGESDRMSARGTTLSGVMQPRLLAVSYCEATAPWHPVSDRSTSENIGCNLAA